LKKQFKSYAHSAFSFMPVNVMPQLFFYWLLFINVLTNKNVVLKYFVI